MPTDAETIPEDQAGYLELLRDNVNFRRLWIGNVISLLGDWFNTIALYSLILELSGSELALGAVFITKMLPWALASPLAGLIVDRYNRRKVMIVSDLLRAVVMLGLLLIDEPDEVYLVYVLTTLQVVIGSVFHPAQSASIPNVTSPRELVTANALMAVTWSMLLTLGAALGGFATAWLGIKAVFILDSLSYLLSAYFIYRAVIPQEAQAGSTGVTLRSALREVLDGWTHLRSHPRVGRIAFAKATWAIAGGGLVYMLTLLGQEVSPESQAIGIGILFAARGLGTGIGPVAARSVFKGRRGWTVLLGAGVAFSGLCYVIVGFVPWTYAVAALVVFAHATSGANWVLSSVMLQERTQDRFRGRVFATEYLLVMMADSISILVASLLLESATLDLRMSFQLFGAVQILSGLMWLLVIVPREKKDDPLAAKISSAS